MAKILIIYGTTQGQTGKVAIRIKEVLVANGHSVDLFDVRKVPSSVVPRNFDAVLIGASVHVGGYQRDLKKWVKGHSIELKSVTSGFFSVCLSVLQKEASVQQEIAKIIEDFFKASLWQPQARAVFAGGLAYSKYSFLVKWWMKRIAEKSGGDTDTSRDYEYTDWNAVSRFTLDFSNSLIRNGKVILPHPQSARKFEYENRT
ncbi:MAG: protoporphyrinogen oxidase [Deltaproteobacteria bacterium]|jgi:menaquinone-dependent protoporphyrinogen oxidase|nr:protoporphyrinogen oxidase [Deltaproteobacteria bacterium]